MCGWCKDRFGLSWQITPRALLEATTDPDVAAAGRAMAEMMTMKNRYRQDRGAPRSLGSRRRRCRRARAGAI